MNPIDDDLQEEGPNDSVDSAGIPLDDFSLVDCDGPDVLSHCDPMNPEEMRASADALILHSLLLHNSGLLDESTHRALEQTLAALTENHRNSSEAVSPSPAELHDLTASSTSTVVRMRWWQDNRVRMAIAASILFVLMTFVWQGRLPNAQTLLAQAYEYSLSTSDREYHVRLQRGPISASGTLLVRGNQAFRLQVRSIAGEQVFGRSDVEYWYAPPIGPVLKSDSRYWIASMLHQHSGGLPYLEPATVIQRLQDGYSLRRELIDDPATQRPTYRIVANNEAGKSDFFRPDRVTLWIDAESGRAIRILLERNPEEASHDIANPSVFYGMLTIEYVKETELSADYYRCESQFPDRTILSRPWSSELPNSNSNR